MTYEGNTTVFECQIQHFKVFTLATCFELVRCIVG